MRIRAKRMGASATLFALLGAVLLLMAPGTGQAVCVPSSPTPTPSGTATAAYTVVNLPDGGKAWITTPSGQLNGQTGAAGPHGFIRAQGNASNASNMSGDIRGHSKDAPLNGYISGSATGGSPKIEVCISVANQPDVKRTIP